MDLWFWQLPNWLQRRLGICNCKPSPPQVYKEGTIDQNSNTGATDQSFKSQEQGPSNNTKRVWIVVSLDTIAVIEVRGLRSNEVPLFVTGYVSKTSSHF